MMAESAVAAFLTLLRQVWTDLGFSAKGKPDAVGLMKGGLIRSRWRVDSVMLTMSVVAHLLFGLLLAVGPRYSPGGEGGFLGAGGPTVEVGIVGSAAAPVEIAEPEVAPPPAVIKEPPDPERPVRRRSEAPPKSEPRAAMVDRGPSREPSTAEEADSDADIARRAVLASEPGTEAEATSEGRAPGKASGAIAAAVGQGTVGEARDVLLGAGTFCEDPVAGTWVAQKYKSEAGRGRWVRFTLEVARVGGRLSGRISSRIWDGSPSEQAPPECRPFHSDMTWAMQAHGLVVGDSMTFGSSHARIVRTDCPGHGAYAPDNFSGRVDPEAERFDARNNDGAYDIDEPYTFRRVACD